MTAQNRFRSPVLWTSVGGLILFIAKNWFHFEIPGWDAFVELIIAVLVGFGVLNNPTSSDKF
ncbi:MAG: holin [Clostridia bacterium]|nr:holin [Clostridia bacterium]